MLMIDLPKLELINGTLPETKEADEINLQIIFINILLNAHKQH